MLNDKILSTLSLAQKAGQAVSGEFAVEKAVREGRACLVVVAEDASENTKKKMRNMADFYKVPLYFYSCKQMLGKCIGKEFRSMVSVKHSGFADSLIKKLSE